MAWTGFPSIKDNAGPGCSESDHCHACYDDDTGENIQKLCCDKERSCGEAHFLFWGGLILIVVGTILSCLSCCGVMACCCFGGAPPTTIKGAAPKAEEITE